MSTKILPSRQPEGDSRTITGRIRRDPELQKDISTGEMFDLLGNPRRLAVISYLLETGGQASVKELSAHIAAKENDISSNEVTPEQHKRVYTALCQCHLPRLDEFNVVAFDDPEKTVMLGETAHQIDSFIRRGHESNAAIIEFGFAVAVVSVVTLGGLGVGPFATVPVLAWAVLITVALFSIGAWNLMRTGAFTNR